MPLRGCRSRNCGRPLASSCAESIPSPSVSPARIHTVAASVRLERLISEASSLPSLSVSAAAKRRSTGAKTSPTSTRRSLQISTSASRIKIARYSSFVILRFLAALSVPGARVRLAAAMARSTSSGRDSISRRPRGLMVLRIKAPDADATTVSSRSTDRGRPLIVEFAGISPSEKTSMTLETSLPRSTSLSGLNRIKDGSSSGEAAARSYSVSTPAATRTPLLRRAVLMISFSVHGLS